MTEKELSIALREIGRSMGMCNPYYGSWNEETGIEEMLRMFKNGQDFCIEKDFPSLEFIRKNFDKELLKENGIFLDEDLDEIITESGTYVLLGKCVGTLRFRDWCVADVYLRHETDVSIDVGGMAKIFVSLYDESRLRDYAGSLKVYDHRKKKEG